MNTKDLIKLVTSGGDTSEIIKSVLLSNGVKSCVVEIGEDGKVIIQSSKIESFLGDYKKKISMIEKLEESLKLVIAENTDLRNTLTELKSRIDGNRK